MFIIPFIHNKPKHASQHIHQYYILTIGGTELWSDPDIINIEADILLPSGIHIHGSPFTLNGAIFCEVDTSKTIMSDFYKWDEISIEDRSTFCWRTFYTFDSKDWLPTPKHASIGPYLYQDVFDMILSQSKPCM